MTYTFTMLPGEGFWGGTSVNSDQNPFTKDSEAYSIDFNWLVINQTMPLFLSNKGRYIWSDNPFSISIDKGVITIEGTDVLMVEAGTCLKDAYIHAMEHHFPFDKKELPEKFFSTAQYNTWMELTYHQTQKDILAYAHGIVDNGFTPGILIIDEGWHGRYGQWDFDPYKFPDPKAMIDELHSLGFTVLLWVTPFVCPDGYQFARNTISALPGAHKDADRLFVRTKEGKVALFEWWNGYSAMLDFRKDCDRDFLKNQLDYLMAHYGVDGFKFDGGHVYHYAPRNMVGGTPRNDHDPHAMNIAWNEFGREYAYHEFKDTYKGGGKNGIQRLCDRGHRWDFDGINTFIPSSIVQGLLGHPFICPDMIGGGEWSYAIMPDFQVDEELFVRMAQCSALCPMMQFSWAPWRVLSPKSLDLVRKSALLHQKLAGEILDLVKDSQISGMPIVRNLEFNYPHRGYEKIVDQFMLGDSILVAPVVTKETYRREVVLPPGLWKDEEGLLYEGGKTHTVDAPIERLPWFRKVND